MNYRMLLAVAWLTGAGAVPCGAQEGWLVKGIGASGAFHFKDFSWHSKDVYQEGDSCRNFLFVGYKGLRERRAEGVTHWVTKMDYDMIDSCSHVRDTWISAEEIAAKIPCQDDASIGCKMMLTTQGLAEVSPNGTVLAFHPFEDHYNYSNVAARLIDDLAAKKYSAGEDSERQAQEAARKAKLEQTEKELKKKRDAAAKEAERQAKRLEDKNN